MKKVFLILFLSVSFITSTINAQEGNKMYSYKQAGDKYIVSIHTGEEIVKALTSFCEEKKIKSGTISGLGAINEVALRFFNPATKKYVDKVFREQMEISNLTGNISIMDGKEYLHMHITVGGADYSARAGHLLSAILNGAGEFVVEDFGEKVERTHNPSLGLNCYDFNK